ncbi:MAG: MFS transporter [Bdellovibrionota bacterium]
MKIKDVKEVLNLTVLVAGLGYFVDLFDITLFGVVRMSSLKDLGITDPAVLLSEGLRIYNAQMIGMMIGGIFWGILADKKGRLSVMFGSIMLYSLANIANAFVVNTDQYMICRFLGGLGLAGELGAAITLVAESLPKEKRGIGTTIVAALGMLGIVAAAFVGQIVPWKTAYIIGGVMGLALLVTRFKMFESSMFEKSHSSQRGNMLLLLQPKRLLKYIGCILAGVPVYFSTGILFTFAPELTAGLGVVGTVTAGSAILWGSIGLTIGDVLSGLLSQTLRSRRKAVGICLVFALAVMLVYTRTEGATAEFIYVLCFLIGMGVGYWAVLVTMAAEQFGTNIRGTVATTVPNFVRGSAVFAVMGFAHLKTTMSIPDAALTVGLICFGLALISLYFMDETFGKDLNFSETKTGTTHAHAHATVASKT